MKIQFLKPIPNQGPIGLPTAPPQASKAQIHAMSEEQKKRNHLTENTGQ